mgnify:CR=1 FL=1
MKSKLGKQGAGSAFGLSLTDKRTKKKDGITTVKKKVKTSYKVPPLTLRMSLTDKQAIGDWVEALQDKTERKVSAAKLFRALVKYKENIDDDELIDLINKMN